MDFIQPTLFDVIGWCAPGVDLATPRTTKALTGIYYLVDYVESGVVVLYVGATRDIRRRIWEHMWREDIMFCDVYFDPCEEWELEEREAQAIAEFGPLLNEKKVA